jgi:hypothetical protein
VAGGLARQGAANEKSAFGDATSEAIGKSRRSVEIAAARGEALGDDLSAISGTSLNKGVELDALAKMGPRDRMKEQRYVWRVVERLGQKAEFNVA